MDVEQSADDGELQFADIGTDGGAAATDGGAPCWPDTLCSSRTCEIDGMQVLKVASPGSAAQLDAVCEHCTGIAGHCLSTPAPAPKTAWLLEDGRLAVLSFVPIERLVDNHGPSLEMTWSGMFTVDGVRQDWPNCTPEQSIVWAHAVGASIVASISRWGMERIVIFDAQGKGASPSGQDAPPGTRLAWVRHTASEFWALRTRHYTAPAGSPSVTLDHRGIDGSLVSTTVLATGSTAVVAYGADGGHTILLMEDRDAVTHAPLAWHVVVVSHSGSVVQSQPLDIELASGTVWASANATNDGRLITLLINEDSSPPSMNPKQRLFRITWDGKNVHVAQSDPWTSIGGIRRLASGLAVSVANAVAPGKIGGWLQLRIFDADGAMLGGPIPLTLPAGVVNVDQPNIEIDDEGILVFGASQASYKSKPHGFLAMFRLDGSVVDAHVFENSGPVWPESLSRHGRHAVAVLRTIGGDNIPCVPSDYGQICTELYRVDLGCNPKR